ncbi:hypothetical protein HK096_010848, partial [Nowakowskiella sp. JEL0078]
MLYALRIRASPFCGISVCSGTKYDQENFLPPHFNEQDFYLPLRENPREISSSVSFKISPRVFITTTIILSQKFVDDRKHSKASWAKISGASVDALNSAEKICLAALEYQLNVAYETYTKWSEKISSLNDMKTTQMQIN